jgi:glutathione-specific gamma-glutamylcyclotransferase
MRLTAEHVAMVHRDVPDGPLPEWATKATDEDYAAAITGLLKQNPNAGEIWFFAYGSLIWKPACAFDEIRTGVVRGWHRRFCLGWNNRFRGSDEFPGLMLALDRGGACKGVLYRLPPGEEMPNLRKLLEREMGFKPSPFPPRWVNATTADGRVIRALTFCIDRNSGRYVRDLTTEQVADSLATAVGSRGSMAEYLFETVAHLERLGIHDPHLWQLQEMVAERIEAAHPAAQQRSA